ncbi:hypothetical protein K432DRAFT_398656 [Lepidopterella palustris CBS 459.81]|uniref:Antifreeze protein n=1 Tax=Lepidopterella palustris CBS 459.81 TaxID=1314670 RepID=A0A8E2DY88_9PEZI|nr:hypothetical protein K432DRAFT_398656 [Lepidopterella palustris CBS 459.81]
MRRPIFQTLLLFLLALIPTALADAPTTAVSTLFMTKTVYRVVTETKTGTPPASIANSTVPVSYGTIVPASSANYTATGTGGSIVVGPSKTAQATFTGAAAHMNANAYIAALVAGVGYLAL